MKIDIFKRIKKLRKNLNKSIEKYGLNSNETKEISKEMDELIKEYYSSVKIVEYPKFSDMNLYYKKSYEMLKSVTLQLNKFPSVQEWNSFAKENNCLSHISLEYISKLNWNYLEIKVKRELNLEI